MAQLQDKHAESYWTTKTASVGVQTDSLADQQEHVQGILTSANHTNIS